MRAIYCLFPILFIALNALAIDGKDTLRALWNNAALPDTVRMLALEDLIWDHYLHTNTDSAIILAEGLLDFAQRSTRLQMVERAYTTLGTAIDVSGDLRRAEPFLKHALEISESTGNRGRLAVNYGNYGRILRGLGNYPAAIDYLLRTRRIMEDIGNDHGVSSTLNNLSLLYADMGEFNTALDLQREAVDLDRRTENVYGLAISLNDLSTLLYRAGDYEAAIALLKEVLNIADETRQMHIKGYALHNLGMYSARTGKDSLAVNFFAEAEALRIETGDARGVTSTAIARGRYYFEHGQIATALRFAEQALALADSLQQHRLQRDATGLLWDLRKTQLRHDEALALFERHVALRDTINNEENNKEIMRQQFLYDFDKREALLRAEQEKKEALANEVLRRKNLQRNASFGGFGLMLLLAIVFFKQRTRIAREKQRSDDLLLNILPAETAEELKSKGTSEARLIECATVLFTDFKGFTALSEQLPPGEVVALINECFSAFDHIMERRGVEKIKTIGDAYMAAGGLPAPNQTHAHDVIQAALEINAFMTQFALRRKALNQPYLEIRIGIHTGPVVAGIVGIKKFQYDIWGDTVNTAARMESSGEIGKVNISQATFDHVSGNVVCHYRGEVEAKGKGPLGMYFVEGSTDAPLSLQADEPPSRSSSDS